MTPRPRALRVKKWRRVMKKGLRLGGIAFIEPSKAASPEFRASGNPQTQPPNRATRSFKENDWLMVFDVSLEPGRWYLELRFHRFQTVASRFMIVCETAVMAASSLGSMESSRFRSPTE